MDPAVHTDVKTVKASKSDLGLKWSLGPLFLNKANEGSELQLWDRLGQQLLSPDVGKWCLPRERIMKGTAAQISVFRVLSPCHIHVQTRYPHPLHPTHCRPPPSPSPSDKPGHLLACIKIKSIPWNLYFSWGQSSILGKPESAKFISFSWNSDI